MASSTTNYYYFFVVGGFIIVLAYHLYLRASRRSQGSNQSHIQSTSVTSTQSSTQIPRSFTPVNPIRPGAVPEQTDITAGKQIDNFILNSSLFRHLTELLIIFAFRNLYEKLNL